MKSAQVRYGYEMRKPNCHWSARLTSDKSLGKPALAACNAVDMIMITIDYIWSTRRVPHPKKIFAYLSVLTTFRYHPSETSLQGNRIIILPSHRNAHAMYDAKLLSADSWQPQNRNWNRIVLKSQIIGGCLTQWHQPRRLEDCWSKIVANSFLVLY